MYFDILSTQDYANNICFQGSTITYTINADAFNDLDGLLEKIKYRLILQPIEISLEKDNDNNNTSQFRALQDKLITEQWQTVVYNQSESYIRVTLPHLPYDVLCEVEVVGIDNHGLETKTPYVAPSFLAVYAPGAPTASIQLEDATITGAQTGKATVTLNIEDWGFIRPYNWKTQDDLTSRSYIRACFKFDAESDAEAYYSCSIYGSDNGLFETQEIARTGYSDKLTFLTFEYQPNTITSQYVHLDAQTFQETTSYWQNSSLETDPIILPQYYPPLQMYRNSVQVTSPLTETSSDYKDSHLLVTSNDEQANIELKGKAELKFSDTSGKEKESIKLDAVTQGTTQLVFDGPIAISDGLGGHAVFHFVNGSLTISIIDAYGRRKDVPITFGALGSQN